MVKKKMLKAVILNSLAVVFLLPAIHGDGVVYGVSSGITRLDGTSFNVDIREFLSVNVLTPETWASGTINEFLTNKVGFSVLTNNPAGFIATMQSSAMLPNLVNLTDSTYVMPTIATASVTIDDATDSGDDFPANRWGYGIVNGNAAAPLTYYPMVGSNDYPIEIASSNVATNEITKDIYFSAKADGTVASGTYANSVIISVVSGVAPDPIDDPIDEPIIDPGEPIIPGPGPDIPIVMSVNPQPGLMSVTTSSSYAKPAGVNDTTISNVNEGVPLAAGIAVAAGVSAAAGVIFFVIAKRRRKDEDDDDGTEDY
ncbi:hypothetical protein J6X73_03125 [Candidatus Saccharibacteria bacterium]|nr:hypothetical protein [Candidatus Saccharibacteria bacterium]